MLWTVRRLIAVAALTNLLLCATWPAPARADDWPQWLGPRRDGVWREGGLLDRIPDGGLPVRWRVPVNGGTAGPIVAAGRVYVTDFLPAPDAPKPAADPFERVVRKGSERVLCVEAATGKVLWTRARDVTYTMAFTTGPRATPVFDENRVYVLGGEGNVWCMDAASGGDVWSARLTGERRPTPTWGFASHPLVEGDLLICLGSGDDPAAGRGVVTAFDKRSGAVRWTALSAREPGYAAPMACTVGGVRQLIIWHPEAVTGLDPATGNVYWSLQYGAARMGLTVATPRPVRDPGLGDVVFLSTYYEGSMVLKLDAGFGGVGPNARVLWARGGPSVQAADAPRAVFDPVDVHDGRVYGVFAEGELRCLDLAGGNRLWATGEATNSGAGPQKWATASLVRLGEASNRYLIANEHGDLLAAELTPAGYRGLGRAHVLEPTTATARPDRPVAGSHPACALQCVFWRNDKELICVPFVPPPPAAPR